MHLIVTLLKTQLLLLKFTSMILLEVFLILRCTEFSGFIKFFRTLSTVLITVKLLHPRCKITLEFPSYAMVVDIIVTFTFNNFWFVLEGFSIFFNFVWDRIPHQSSSYKNTIIIDND